MTYVVISQLTHETVDHVTKNLDARLLWFDRRSASEAQVYTSSNAVVASKIGDLHARNALPRQHVVSS